METKNSNGLKSRKLAPHRCGRWSRETVPVDTDGAYRVRGRLDGRDLHAEWKQA